MKYNFDRRVERRNTHSLKFDDTERFCGLQNVWPMWVADMDFESPEAVTQAVSDRLGHRIYGYPVRPAAYYEAVIQWMNTRHAWHIERDWILCTPGILPAVNLAVAALTQPGDKIVMPVPIYPPLMHAVTYNHRERVDWPLTRTESGYAMDFDRLADLVDGRTKMLMLCNPHNPVGRVWRRDELNRLAEICLDRNLIILSDDIHADLVLPGHRHVPIATLSPEVAHRVVTFTSPNKTFNLAGFTVGHTIVGNPELRASLAKAVGQLHLGSPNLFDIVATMAAYEHGEDWLDQLLVYIDGNLKLLRRSLAAGLPRVRLASLEGTYLAWLDMRGLGLSEEEVRTRLLQKARVFLSDGRLFGPGGEGHQRLNLATARSRLKEAVDNILEALAA